MNDAPEPTSRDFSSPILWSLILVLGLFAIIPLLDHRVAAPVSEEVSPDQALPQDSLVTE